MTLIGIAAIIFAYIILGFWMNRDSPIVWNFDALVGPFIWIGPMLAIAHAVLRAVHFHVVIGITWILIAIITWGIVYFFVDGNYLTGYFLPGIVFSWIWAFISRAIH